ncbi:MAG: restriction endonuclease [Candidatus Nitrosocosmicus sp.]|nr:restriction endonuclease [Candidatus Nitrosocosmicus sp.]
MKICPNCGYKIDFGSAKFCHNCGNHLKEINTSEVRQIDDEKISKLSSSNALFQHIVNQNNDTYLEDKQEENEDVSSIYDLGVNLEEVVEQILKKRGFYTKRRLKIRGRSNSLSEIDILASKRNLDIVVECKNYDRETVVGIKEVRDFHSKLTDIQHYGASLFVTYGKFSSDSMTYADKYNIELWDGERLSQIHLSMLVGRHYSNSSSSKNFGEVVLEAALPVSWTFEEITNLHLKNPSAVKISGYLLFRPYYVFDYKLDSIRMDRKGKIHRIKDEGECIVDAITELVLYENVDKTKNLEHLFFSKKQNKGNSEFEDTLKSIENGHIYNELTNIDPKIHYKLKDTPDYSIQVLEPTLSMKTANYIVFDKIIEDNIKEISYKIKNSRGESEEKTMTIIPKKSDIIIKKSLLIYVPIWVLAMQSKEITYAKRALAASKTILVDEMALCPKDFSSLKIWGKKKSTHALCETCGTALCEDHIERYKEVFYCKEHAK